MALKLTVEDREVLKRTPYDPSLFVEWYFGENYALYEYQAEFSAAILDGILNTLVLGGWGCGKTLGCGFTALILCTLNEYFKFLNVAPTYWQASVMFHLLRERINASGKYKKFVKKISAGSYPTIELVTGSTLEFRSIGREGEGLLTGEWDWINYDQAEVEDTERALHVLRGRLRGTRANGQPRLGALSLTCNPGYAPFLEDWLARGLPGSKDYEPGRFRAWIVPTWANVRGISPEQRRELESLPPDLRRVYIEANMPHPEAKEFSFDAIRACTDRDLNLLCESMVDRGIPGAVYEEDPKFGVVRFELPPRAGRVYCLTGDPGTGKIPYRGAPCNMVFDVSQKPAQLVYFAWFSGDGKYEPWIDDYLYAIRKYEVTPAMRSLDATGPGDTIEELVFAKRRITVDPVNFVREKGGMLTALKLAFDRQTIKVPFIKGMRDQLLRYQLPDTKIAQDIVVCLMMIARTLELHGSEPKPARRMSRAAFRNRTSRSAWRGAPRTRRRRR